VRQAKSLAAAFGVFGLWWGAWAASLPAIKLATHASTAQLGLALFAVSLASLPTMFLSGRLSDRRLLVAWSLAAFAAAGALPALAHTPLTLFALLLFVGAATGGLDIAINARASALETARRAHLMDGLHAAFSIGVLVGGVSAGLLRRAGAQPEAILVGVAVLLAAAANARADTLPARVVEPRRLGKRLVAIGAILGLAFLVENGLETWSAVFLERGLGSSPGVSGLGPGLFAGSMATGRLLAQRVERTSVTGRMAFAGTAAAAGLLVAATATTPAVALAGFVIAGGGLALSAPTLFGAAGRIGGGAAISAVAAVGYLGFLGGPPLYGAVAGATSLRGGFALLACTAILLAGCARLLPRLADEECAR
jgi:MFS family permease